MQTIQPLTSDAYETLFGDLITTIDAQLTTYLSGDVDEPIAPPKRLWEAMRYSTLGGGKRIRSVLAIETTLALGGQVKTVMPTACAIELVHAQSLIHDDLPCMDDDDLRRGQPTLHKAFGESTAVLAGDALLALAFGVVARYTPQSPQVTPQALTQLIADFSDVASVRGLVNGQYVDIDSEGKAIDKAILEYIHTYKTGALFGFATRAGAVLAGRDTATTETLTQFGKTLGLAFQIVDDLLDIRSPSETLGKTAGKDITQQKATYPALYGEQASQDQADQLIGQAIDLLDTVPHLQAERLRFLAQYIQHRIH